MDITFKRGGHEVRYWLQGEMYCEISKGYWVYINGNKSQYFIDKCEVLGDWSCWDTKNGGEMYCGGLTLRDTKETFIKLKTK